jgi:hypothetical protein
VNKELRKIKITCGKCVRNDLKRKSKMAASVPELCNGLLVAESLHTAPVHTQDLVT